MEIKDNDIVMDLFAGSGTTAHAVFELNKETHSKCSVILVQYPELLETMNKNAKGNAKKITANAIRYLKSQNKPLNICELAKERLRLTKEQIKNTSGLVGESLDTGFRVLKVDSSNMADVFYAPDALNQHSLLDAVSNIKYDRTAEDLLFQVLLDWGVDLTLPIRQENIQGKTVFFVDEDALVACFDKGITEDFVRELTAFKPLRMVFLDNGFTSDAVKINAEQIFKQLSPSTEVRAL